MALKSGKSMLRVLIVLAIGQIIGWGTVGLLSVVAWLQSFITRAITARKSGSLVAQDASDDCGIVSTEDDLLLCCMDANNEVNCDPVLKVLKPD